MREPTADELASWRRDTMMEALGIRILSVQDGALVGDMPVDRRTKQIFGRLHGGASVALAETLGSLAATLSVDAEACRCVGLEINANHIRGASGGRVTGIARALHVGKSTHVWQVHIVDDAQQLVCISRLTVAILATGGPRGR